MKWMSIWIIAAFLAACSSTPAAKRKNTQNSSVKKPNSAVQNIPKTQIPANQKPDGLFQNAMKYYKAKDFNKAYDFFLASAAGFSANPNSGNTGPATTANSSGNNTAGKSDETLANSDRLNKETEARIWGLRSLSQAGRTVELAQLSQPLLKVTEHIEPTFAEIAEMRYQSLISNHDFVEAFYLCSDVLGQDKDQKDSAEKEKHLKIQSLYLQRAHELMDSHLQVDQLDQIAKDLDTDRALGVELKSHALLRLGELALEEKEVSYAKGFLEKSFELGSKFNFSVSGSGASQASVNSGANVMIYSTRAKYLLEQLESVSKVNPQTIGVVLPMSGKFASVGQKTLRGLELGFGLHSSVPSPYKISVVDSEGNPEKARKGVETLVKDDNVIAIVGSVLSKNAPAVASTASEYGVPNVALSQKSGITETSPMVFRNALTSEMQVRELVRIAMEDLGLTKFAILFPNDAYGVEFANLFWDEVLARGGRITAAQTYSNKETDFKNPIQRLTGTFFTGARADEYKLRAKELKDKRMAEKKSALRNEEATDILPPVVDFEAVFIPDNPKSLGQISAMLSYVGVKSVHLLGTNIWNSPGLAKRSGLFASSTIFVDSFSEFDPRFKSANTIKEFQSVYKELPGSFEIQGYDTALMIKSLISKGLNSREQLNQGLAQLRDVPGALSLMSMDTADREVNRPVFGFSLEKGEITPYHFKTKTP